jgi:competence protein ComEA
MTLAVERLERKPVEHPTAPAIRTGKIRSGEPPIDVNTAGPAELERLPGIGPVMAARIIDTRQAGRFRTADDLRRVRGIGPKTLETLRPFVTCGETPPADQGP